MSDTALEQSIQRLAQQAVDISRDRFKKTLDFSEDSLEDVERILTELHNSRPKGLIGGLLFGRLLKRGASAKQIQYMSAAWGAYVGEIIRRRWGGEWRRVAKRGPGPKIALRVKGMDVFPPVQVANRLTRGTQYNIVEYFENLKAKFERK